MSLRRSYSECEDDVDCMEIDCEGDVDDMDIDSSIPSTFFSSLFSPSASLNSASSAGFECGSALKDTIEPAAAIFCAGGRLSPPSNKVARASGKYAKCDLNHLPPSAPFLTSREVLRLVIQKQRRRGQPKRSSGAVPMWTPQEEEIVSRAGKAFEAMAHQMRVDQICAMLNVRPYDDLPEKAKHPCFGPSKMMEVIKEKEELAKQAEWDAIRAGLRANRSRTAGWQTLHAVFGCDGSRTALESAQRSSGANAPPCSSSIPTPVSSSSGSHTGAGPVNSPANGPATGPASGTSSGPGSGSGPDRGPVNLPAASGNGNGSSSSGPNGVPKIRNPFLDDDVADEMDMIDAMGSVRFEAPRKDYPIKSSSADVMDSPPSSPSLPPTPANADEEMSERPSWGKHSYTALDRVFMDSDEEESESEYEEGQQTGFLPIAGGPYNAFRSLYDGSVVGLFLRPTTSTVRPTLSSTMPAAPQLPAVSKLASSNGWTAESTSTGFFTAAPGQSITPGPRLNTLSVETPSSVPSSGFTAVKT